MGNITNDFSWSWSKGKNLRECCRRVYLGTYGSWGGWERSADPVTRELYLLKNMISRHSWAGKVVHGAIIDVFNRARRGEAVVPDAAVDRCLHGMRAGFRASASKQYLSFGTKKSLGLVEHHYGLPTATSDWKETAEKVERCVRNLFTMATYQEAIAAVQWDGWLVAEELSSIMVSGVRCFVMPDFVFRRQDKKIVVVDWKTGKPSEQDAQQLVGYAMYATEQWGCSIGDISGRLVYLDDAHGVDIEFTEDDVAMFTQRVQDDAANMRARLDYQDPVRNRTSIDRWPMTENQWSCRSCEYQGPCGRGINGAR